MLSKADPIRGKDKRFHATMLKSRDIIVAIIFSSFCLYAQEVTQVPPKELVEYVRDAQKAGTNARQIQQTLVDAGWPVKAVNDALTYLKSNEKDKPKAGAKADSPASPSPAVPVDVAAKVAEKTETPPSAEKTEAAPSSDKTSAPANAAPSEAVPETATTNTPASPTTNLTKTAARPSVLAENSGTSPSFPPDSNPLGEYKIGAGDVLKITVWHEPDASLQSGVVPPDGRLSLPLLHNVEVGGLTVPELEKLLTERYSALIDVPEVSVIVTAMNSKKIYLWGKVRKEGPLLYTYEMTVMQALNEAGGVTDFAKKKNIYVLRSENGKQFKIRFDYAAILRGEHLETNVRLIPGDMIVVP